MGEQILFDTDILIDAARAVPEAVAFFEQLDGESCGVISSITQMELLVGCRNKNEFRTLDQFLKRFTIIHVTPEISEMAVALIRRYRLSHGLLIPDALVASTALTADYAFVTRNQRDYRFIDGIRLLTYPHHR